MPEIQFVPGRRTPHPEDTHPRMHAARVLAKGYTGAVPPAVDWHAGIDFPEYLNQQIGDCTAADVGHAEQVFSHYGQGATITVTDDDVLRLYEATSGYDPRDPTSDQGAVIQDVLDYWRKTGIAGHKILAFLQVNHADLAEIHACCWLFGGVTLGVNLPNSALDQFGAGQPWVYDRGADNSNAGGHDVRIVGYDTSWLYVVTWGRVQQVSPEWVTHFAEESWSEATGEWIKNNASPEGLDVAALNAAFRQITGKPGPFPGSEPSPQPPAPTPGPGPVPVPPAVDDADRTLARTVRDWAASPHIGANAVAARAVKLWLIRKGLAS